MMEEHSSFANPTNLKTYVLCAAIWYDDGEESPSNVHNIKTGQVILGYRHSNCYQILKQLYPDRRYLKDCVEGFLTSNDLFIDRTQGAKLAYDQRQCNQVEILTSECLYSSNRFLNTDPNMIAFRNRYIKNIDDDWSIPIEIQYRFLFTFDKARDKLLNMENGFFNVPNIVTKNLNNKIIYILVWFGYTTRPLVKLHEDYIVDQIVSGSLSYGKNYGNRKINERLKIKENDNDQT